MCVFPDPGVIPPTAAINPDGAHPEPNNPCLPQISANLRQALRAPSWEVLTHLCSSNLVLFFFYKYTKNAHVAQSFEKSTASPLSYISPEPVWGCELLVSKGQRATVPEFLGLAVVPEFLCLAAVPEFLCLAAGGFDRSSKKNVLLH